MEYKKARPFMNTGDIVETASPGFLGSAIRFFTKKEVNHTAFLLRSNLDILNDRRFLLESLDLGLEFTKLSDTIKTPGKLVWWSRLTEPADSIIRIKMARFAIEEGTQPRKKKRYSWRQMLVNAWRRTSVTSDRYFCSEFNHAILEHVGLVEYGLKARRPGEFHESPHFEGIYDDPIEITI